MAFYDDGHLPAVLVENKVDLLPPEEQDDITTLNEFAQNNGFNGCFRTSAKTGKNISESMEFLIKDIIKRLEEINSKGGDVNNRQSVALDPDKHNKEADAKRKQEKSGCC